MFPTAMEYLGVRMPQMQQLLQEWWIEIKKWPPGRLTNIAKELVDTKNFEANQVAFELLWKNKTALNQLNIHELEYLGKNLDNWATTDTFSVMLAGWAWRMNQIRDADILRWLETGNRWWRRVAVVSTVGLNLKSRGGTGDTRRTLMICEKVVRDRDDMIVKALSRALRELSKRDKPSVESFIKKHQTNLARRVCREVSTKLETGKKNV